ncbi:MAG: hypothetical protein GC159_14525 [Phycisphaera sp.]|nr:hypothetical protein [Phycisphaera sp.]
MNHDFQAQKSALPWPVVALVAWLVPGLGHLLIGRRDRAVILAATIYGMFIAGLFMGGIDVIDPVGDRLWFGVGQVHAGALAIGVAGVRMAMDVKAEAAPYGSPEAVPEYQPSVGRVNELGTLYCALAGGLNLLCVLDVIGRITAAEEQRLREAPSSRGRASEATS